MTDSNEVRFCDKCDKRLLHAEIPDGKCGPCLREYAKRMSGADVTYNIDLDAMLADVRAQRALDRLNGSDGADVANTSTLSSDITNNNNTQNEGPNMSNSNNVISLQVNESAFQPLVDKAIDNAFCEDGRVEHVLRGIVAQEVHEAVDAIDVEDYVDTLARRFDASDIAEHVDVNEVAQELNLYDIAEAVAEHIEVLDIANCLDADTIAECIRVSDVAEHVSVSAIAEHLDYSEVCSRIEWSEVAQHVSVGDVAYEIRESDRFQWEVVTKLAQEVDHETVAHLMCTNDFILRQVDEMVRQRVETALAARSLKSRARRTWQRVRALFSSKRA